VNNLLRGSRSPDRPPPTPRGALRLERRSPLGRRPLPAPPRPRRATGFPRRGQARRSRPERDVLERADGLCRPEELVRLFRFATQLGAETGVPVRSAMIQRRAGYTWASVTAMAQAGVRVLQRRAELFRPHRRHPPAMENKRSIGSRPPDARRCSCGSRGAAMRCRTLSIN